MVAINVSFEIAIESLDLVGFVVAKDVVDEMELDELEPVSSAGFLVEVLAVKTFELGTNSVLMFSGVAWKN